MGNGVGAAVVFQDHEIMLRLPHFSTIYTVEVAAISYALDVIQKRNILKAVIISDSLVY